jgi:hypothetical protein
MASGDGAAQSAARVQAIASARIISGEQVRFGDFAKAGQTVHSQDGKLLYQMPPARSSGEISDSMGQKIDLVEFY